MRFFTITTLTALLSVSVYALPSGDGSVIARSAEPEAIAEALAEAVELYARDKDIKYGAQPTKDLKCPKTARYGEHTFTENQIKAAFIGGAKLNAKDKQIGANKYPHKYNSNQELPNKCGSNTQEFPILTDNKIYDGDAVTTVPDRVLYEVKDKKKNIEVKFCGVIRHGDGNGFENCP